MARYKCPVCGYIHDEEKEGKPFSSLTVCPICGERAERFASLHEDNAPTSAPASGNRALD